MYKRLQAATAIMAVRANNPPIYCWVEPDWLDGGARSEAQQIAGMQKKYPLREIVPVSWRV